MNNTDMDRKERLALLNKEVKEIGNLLAGISEYDKIPGVLLEMLQDKTIGLAEGVRLLGDATNSPAPHAATLNETTSHQEERMAQQRAEEQRELEVREAQQRAAEQRMALQRAEEQRAEEQRMAEQRAAEKRELEVREAQQRAAEQRLAQQRAEEERAAQQRGAQQRAEENVKPVEPKEFFGKVFQKFSSSETKSVNHPSDIRKLMTLNDRFLFQRELFRGDVGMMNFVLDQMNGFSSLAEGHAFLEKEFNWDPEATGVVEFNALLEQYFNSKHI